MFEYSHASSNELSQSVSGDATTENHDEQSSTVTAEHCVQNAHPMITRAKAGIHKPKVYQSSISFDHCEPSTFQQALNSTPWINATKIEYDALMRNKMWELCPLPPNKELVCCKWVFKLKKHAEGTIARHKARLVARGFTQNFGLDYLDTFSPVVEPITVRIVLTVALARSWTIRQKDIDNAFLNGELQENICMAEPHGFEASNGHGLVCKLKKAIYGFKQASRVWNLKLCAMLQGFSFSLKPIIIFFIVEYLPLS